MPIAKLRRRRRACRLAWPSTRRSAPSPAATGRRPSAPAPPRHRPHARRRANSWPGASHTGTPASTALKSPNTSADSAPSALTCTSMPRAVTVPHMAQLVRQHADQRLVVAGHLLHQLVGHHDGAAGQRERIGADAAACGTRRGTPAPPTAAAPPAHARTPCAAAAAPRPAARSASSGAGRAIRIASLAEARVDLGRDPTAHDPARGRRQAPLDRRRPARQPARPGSRARRASSAAALTTHGSAGRRRASRRPRPRCRPLHRAAAGQVRDAPAMPGALGPLHFAQRRGSAPRRRRG